MAGRGVGHAPVADPTNTYCTVEGCGRYLSRKDPRQHRRGIGSAQRATGTGATLELAQVLARLAAIEQHITRVEQGLAAAPRLRVDMRILTEAFNETIEPVCSDLDAIKVAISQLRMEVRQQNRQPVPLAPTGHPPAPRIERVG